MRAVEFNKRRDNIVDVQHIPLCVAPRSGLQWQALVYGKPRRPQPVGLRPLFGGVLLRRAVHDPAYAVHVAVPEVPQDLIGIGRQHHDLLRRERLEDVAPVLVDRPAIGAHLGRKRGDRSFPAAEGQSCRPRRPLVRHDAVLELLRHAPDLPVRELVDEGALDDDADSVGEPLPHALLLLEVCLDPPLVRLLLPSSGLLRRQGLQLLLLLLPIDLVARLPISFVAFRTLTVTVLRSVKPHKHHPSGADRKTVQVSTTPFSHTQKRTFPQPRCKLGISSNA
mmetsp:Transcript_42351/g.100510  ORF Transcript_42351/g.100510 Transcript_42351/m.100510 type:complete len:280 (+) Transcript_42351:368-1207(+)